jgi:hypothetical protein
MKNRLCALISAIQEHLTSLQAEKLMAACILIIFLVFSPLAVEVVQAPLFPFRRWAGYRLYGYETYTEEGVRGKIYTIDPYVPQTGSVEMLAEWVGVMFQYSPCLYWLQVGYYKGRLASYTLQYYYEYWDSSGHSGIRVGRWGNLMPQNGSLHDYLVVHPYAYGGSIDPWEWRVFVDGSPPGSDLIRVHPYDAVDQQAFVETVSLFPAIKVDGSHFKTISYFTMGKYWNWVLWDTHQKIVDNEAHDPAYDYSLLEVSDSEFIASGGG